MIILKEKGRFGNQLFQINYAFRLRKNDEKIMLIGFEQTKDFFLEEKYILRISSNFLIRISSVLLRIFKKMKIFSKYVESSNGGMISFTRGFFDKVKILDGFFQSEKYICPRFLGGLMSSKKFQREDMKAKKFLNTSKKKIKTYIHIRLKDYNIWPSIDKSAAISLSWYCKMYKKFFFKKKDIITFVFSDDLLSIKRSKKFSSKRFNYISKGYLPSFFIMKNCDHGILSASTFSWWASYLASKNSNKNYYIAPNYWAGHKSKEFIPKKIKSSFLKYQ